MKIQLFNPATDARGGDPSWFYPPSGVLYLASYVRKLFPEIEWKISDGKLKGEERILAEFGHFKPDIAGISFASTHASAAYRLVNKLRGERPDMLIVCGGPHCSIMSQDVFTNSPADVVVVGEGEEAFATVVQDFMKGNIRAGEKHVVHAKLIEDIDSIPFPARDLVDVRQYPGFLEKKGRIETTIFMTRGCPYQCWFCANPVWKAQKPWTRFRSPSNIADELQLLKEEYGVDEVFDISDEANVSLEHSKKIWDEIIQRELGLHFKVNMTARSRNYDEELVAMMAEAGCWMVLLGIESGNQETLDGIGKGTTMEGVITLCELLKRYKIQVRGLFMFFNAWERDGELRFEGVRESLNTISFARSLLSRKLISHVNCSFTTPLPGSPLWNTAMKYKLMPREYIGTWDIWDDSMVKKFFLPGVSHRDWNKVRVEAGKLEIRAVFSQWMVLNLRSWPFLLRRGMIFFRLLLKFLNVARRKQTVYPTTSLER